MVVISSTDVKYFNKIRVYNSQEQITEVCFNKIVLLKKYYS